MDDVGVTPISGNVHVSFLTLYTFVVHLTRCKNSRERRTRGVIILVLWLIIQYGIPRNCLFGQDEINPQKPWSPHSIIHMMCLKSMIKSPVISKKKPGCSSLRRPCSKTRHKCPRYMKCRCNRITCLARGGDSSVTQLRKIAVCHMKHLEAWWNSPFNRALELSNLWRNKLTNGSVT